MTDLHTLTEQQERVLAYIERRVADGMPPTRPCGCNAGAVFGGMTR